MESSPPAPGTIQVSGVTTPMPASAVAAAADVNNAAVPSEGLKPAAVKARSKKRKGKSPRDIAAPKQPLTGYVRYLNVRREQLRAENPGLSFTEMTRQMANEWGKLDPKTKQPYIDAADQDRERYLKEWAEYKKTDSYKEFREMTCTEKGNTTQSKKSKQNTNTASVEATVAAEQPAPTAAPAAAAAPAPVSRAPTPPRPRPAITPASGEDNTCNGESDIPIFTEQFLQHNKQRETELRQLRKTYLEYEQQNAILQRHAEEVTAARARLRAEAAAAAERTQLLLSHRAALVHALQQAFRKVTLPGMTSGLTETNIDEFAEALQTLAETKGNPILKQAKDILNRIELPNLS